MFDVVFVDYLGNTEWCGCYSTIAEAETIKAEKEAYCFDGEFAFIEEC